MIKLETSTHQYETTTLSWKDIKPKWIDWSFLDKQPQYNIILTTMMGVGKTFGCADYYLRKKQVNISILLNTYGIIPQQSNKLLDDLKGENATATQISQYTEEDLARVEYYKDWSIDGDYWVDFEGNKRVYWAAINTYSKAKGARGFYPEIVVYDEFNQNVKYAEQSGTTVKPKLDIIISRFANEEQSPKHIYYFANKDPLNPIQGTTLLNDLGVYTLKGFGEVFKVNNKWEQFILPLTMVINPQYTEEDKISLIEGIVNNYHKKPYYVDLLLNGSGAQSLFNSDEWGFEEFIKPTNSKKLLYTIYWSNQYIRVYEQWREHPNINNEIPIIHIKATKKKPKDSVEILTWRKVENEDMEELSIVHKQTLLDIFREGKLTYENSISRVMFANMLNRQN